MKGLYSLQAMGAAILPTQVVVFPAFFLLDAGWRSKTNSPKPITNGMKGVSV